MSLAFSEEASGATEAPRHAPMEIAAANQSLLRFITCGSVDDGKSTLIGRLLYDSKAVFDDQLDALDRDSRRFGTQGEALDLALLVDGLQAEREQGITIDVAYRYFSTPRRAFIVADTPGHEQYTRNMATGASTAELAVILIDARKGILPQTRRHSFIVSMLGVRHVAVAVNKMDLLDFDRATFERICAVYRSVAADLGFVDAAFFPISARDGDNVTRLSPKTPWYKGRSLLDYLETVQIAPSQGSQELLFPVQWVSRPDHGFRGYAGSVARGLMRRGDEIVTLPRRSHARIERIVTADGELESATEGQAVTLTLDREIDVSRGDVIVAATTHLAPRRRLKARLLWTGDAAFTAEASYFIKLGAALVQARVVVEHTIDVHSFAPSPVTELTMNGIAQAVVTIDRDVLALPYRATSELGGFILIDKRTNETVAFGLVEPDETDEPAPSADLSGWRRWARSAERYFTGDVPADGAARDTLVGLVATHVASALIVLVLTASPLIALIFAVIDAAVRPLVRDVCRQLLAKWATRRPDDFNSDGAGI